MKIVRIRSRSYESLGELIDRSTELKKRFVGGSISKKDADEWNDITEAMQKWRDDDLSTTDKRERVTRIADRGGNTEAGVSFHDSTRTSVDVGAVAEIRSQALAANEREVYLPEASREHMETMLREDDDPEGRLARYVVTLASRDYFRAFATWLRDPLSGGHEWTPEQREAVQRVRQLERTMQITVGGQGGFLLPYALDPAIVIAGTGKVDSMRAVSRVETTLYNEKRFVTSVGVTSHWYAEEAEVTDDAPALLQPAIICRKAMAFVPISFELYEDSTIAQQIGAVFADSKAVEESRVFTTGNGTTEPKGIITAISAVGGSTIATGTNVLAQGDLYANQAALPPRWRPNAKWMMNLSILNGYRQLPQATGLNYSIVNDDGPLPKALGWEIYENSAMDGTLSAAAADYLVLSGDFQQYAIVDRVGTSLELIPNLVGTNRRPTAQRGFLMHWRVGADALVPDAFRVSNFNT